MTFDALLKQLGAETGAGLELSAAGTCAVVAAFKNAVTSTKAQRFLSHFMQQELYTDFLNVCWNMPLEEWIPGTGRVHVNALPGAEMIVTRDIVQSQAPAVAPIVVQNKTFALEMDPDGKGATIRFTGIGSLRSAANQDSSLDAFGSAVIVFELRLDLSNEDDLKVVSYKIGQTIEP